MERAAASFESTKKVLKFRRFGAFCDLNFETGRRVVPVPASR
jgi:hypothetical protein